jgi:enamine deaminase RidA (YjgF/YER057c/UK114 family)
MGRILKVAHIANAFDPTADDAHYTRFRNHDEKSGHTLGEKAMWEVCLPRLKPSAALLGLLFATVLVPAARSEEPKLSISGYDPVAYFTDGKPGPGKSEFEYLWHKLRWRFADGAHRELFVKDPDRYTPQYDGYCAMGAAGGEAAHKDTVDPEAWAIVDGKLYLTHVRQTMETWRQKPAEYIKRADENWAVVKDLPEPVIVGPPCAASPTSTLVALRGGGHWVVVGPEAARDEGGNIVGKGDMRAQLEQVGKNVEACLKAAGASLSDIIETRAYLDDPDQLAKYADLRKQYFGSASPARTIVKKGRLSDPDGLVEVMAFAAVQ